ncbi:MAG: thermonuclease family protein [Bacilli bacterium]|nr:thermonuclease family protein [Bacilli bacterium]
MKLRRIFLPVALLISSIGAFAGCSNKVDYVSQCKLDSSLTYEGKSFLNNGIGLVTVKKYIDGDTTHFTQVETAQRLVKARYLGVDTPESTGKIQPYGKKASNFTKKKLSEAKTIVITNDIPEIGTAASPDSTGSRFKAFVWISNKENAKVSDLRCLNLMLVQEGLSTGKSISGSPLTQYFTDADLQAQNLKLNIWSGKDDPDFYNGPATPTTLKELADEFVANGFNSKFNAVKIEVTGIVCKIYGSYDCFIVDADDAGNQYGLYVFTMYKSYSPLLTLGNKVKLIGFYTFMGGCPQLVDVSYNPMLPGDGDMQIISRDNDFTIKDITIPEASSKAAMNTVVNIHDLHVYGGYDEIDKTTQKASGAFTLKTRDSSNNTINIRIPDDVWCYASDDPEPENPTRITTWEYFSNKTISLTGAITFFAPDEDDPDDGTYQIKLCDKDDVIQIAE